MPALGTVLEYQDLTGFVQALEFPEFQLLGMIPKATTESETVSWDVIQPTVEIDTNFVDQRSAARPAAPQVYEKKTMSLFTDFWFKNMNAGELTNLRRVGSEERDARGRSMLDREAAELARRFGAYKTEYMISQMLTGTLNFKVDGTATTMDYEIPTTHKPNAAATWATAGSNILTDLDTWKNLIAADYGREATTVLLNSKTMSYVMRNTDVLNLLGQTGRGVQIAETGRVYDLYGLNWIVVNGRYGGASATTFNTKHIIDDKVIMIPDMSADWIQLYEGLATYPTADMSDFNEAIGPVAWTRAIDSPTGVNVYYKYSRLPVLKIPEAVVYAEVTP